MFNQITHPVSGIAASAFTFMMTLPTDLDGVVQLFSTIIGLIIAVLSAIMTVEKFIKRNKDND